MRALITGVSGFVGRHLATELGAAGYNVSGFDLRQPDSRIASVDEVHSGDVTDSETVEGTLRSLAPDVVFHLAGAASVGASFADPLGAFTANLFGTLNVLEAARRSERPPRLICVTSAEVYGAVPPIGLPVDELSPLAPHSPYGASKAAADLAVQQYHRGFGLDAIPVRPFNHIGPGQDARFVVPSIARQIAEGEFASVDRITVRVGNVESRRDFLDVRDVVRAYRLIAERGRSGLPYVVGKGRSESVGEIIAMLCALASKPVDVVADASLQRPGEPPDLYCSPARLRADTGWTPSRDLRETLTDTLAWWRTLVAKEQR